MCLASEMAIESVQVKWLGVTASKQLTLRLPAWRAVWHSQDYCLSTFT